LITGKSKPIRIAVKYCGNCNPEIDAPRIIGQWINTLGNDEITFHPEGKRAADLLVIICGCRKACVDRPEFRAMGRQIILIKGRRMGGVSSGEVELARRLIQSVLSIREKSES
jgi:hypothetical protein